MDHDTIGNLLIFVVLGVVGFGLTMLWWKMRYSVFVDEGERQYGRGRFWLWFFVIWLVLGLIRVLIDMTP
ncbi:hypothetical protein IT157_01530 [bacterium]|nr:hypothetical protein [bacterium]